MSTVLISGATAGIGKAAAERFAKEGWNVVITGRREERLQELKNSLEKTYGVSILPLSFDIRSAKETHAAIASLHAEWKQIDVLVNNAGLALGTGPIQEGDTADWDTMIDTNVKGLLYLSREIMPMMVTRKTGHIINLCSIAGKEVYKGGNIYNATKFAVDALTKGMRIDLLEHGIRVTGIYPGKVDTEFSTVRFKGDTERAHKEYTGYQALTAEDVADTVYYAASRPAHVNISELLIMPTAQANTTHLYKKSE